ncbi:MAG TPA: LuxR C-terminal-related transcriptional regulator, partial [Thermoleophilia bacterium]|nr:LuxR C-terminal-related transcriptional regulator [Thermoleophilia bacterium]
MAVDRRLASPLVESKLRVPVRPQAYLERTRLVDRLDTVFTGRLGLIVAPAGFGKTAVVAEWLDRHPEVPRIWVTADERDNDPVRLWAHIIAASRQALPRSDLGVGAAVERGVTDANYLADGLIADLGREAGPLVICLDDVHTLESDEAVASIDRLIRYLPPSTRLVAMARHDPLFGVSRLRLSDGLEELRAAGLRLSRQESAALIVETMGLRLGADSVARIHERCDGWVAGERLLASAAARDRGPAAVLSDTPADATLADYVLHEVLRDLSPVLREFLLETSVLNDLSPAICDDVTGRRDSGRLLATLARDGLFLSRLAGKEDAYRCHELFREVLQIEMRRAYPERLIELHGRATDILFDRGRIVEAVDNALAAGESRKATDLLLRGHRDLLAAGRIATVIDLATRIEDAMEDPSLELMLVMAYALMFAAGDGLRLDRELTRVVERAAAEGLDDGAASRWEWSRELALPFDEDPQTLLAVFRGQLARRAGDVDRLLAERQSLEKAPPFGLTLVAEALLWLERYTEAEAALTRAVDFGTGDAAPPHVQVLARGYLALLRHRQGRLAEAEQIAQRTLVDIEEYRLWRATQSVPASLAQAWVAWERGALTSAKAALEKAFETAAAFNGVPRYVESRIIAARVSFSQGRPVEAYAALDAARTTPAGRAVSSHFAEWLAMERARLSLLQSDLSGAAFALPDWRARIEHGARTMREHLLLARFAVVAGWDTAALLDAPPPGLEVTLPHQLELHKLRGIAALAAEDERRALAELRSALELAVRTGHRQMFIDDRLTLGDVLYEASDQVGFEMPRQRDLDALTEREMDVLRLLPGHLGYREIGAELSVSENTVKSHVKAVFRKLGTTNRGDTVRVARRTGLLPAARRGLRSD